MTTQLESCRAYAALHGMSVVAEFGEDVSGATPIESRPQGGQAYKALERGKANALIVHAMDRLVRPPDEGDEWEMPVFIRSLAKLGREIHTVERGRIGTSFSDLLIAVVDAKHAGDERRKIVERTSRGAIDKARSGRWVGIGVAPFGYRKVGKGKDTHLEFDAAKAKIVRRIFSWLDDDRISVHETARRLNKVGVSAPGRWATGKVWRHSTVLRLVRNTAYIGVLRFRGVEINLPDLAIVDREQFDRVQKRLKRNRELSSRNRKRDYLLSNGYLKCYCGYSMIGSALRKNKPGSVTLYYVCTRYNNLRSIDRSAVPDTCRYWRTDRIDPIVWGWLVDVITHHDKLQEAALEYRERQGRGVVDLAAEAANLSAEIERTQKRIAQLAKDISDMDTGTARNALKAELADLSRKVESKMAEREELLRQVANTPRPADNVTELVSDLRKAIAGDVPYAAKREILDALDVVAQFEGEGVRVTSTRLGVSGWRAFDCGA